MWQYTDKGKLAGINGCGCPLAANSLPRMHTIAVDTAVVDASRALRSGVDTSRYHGTQQQLEALVGL
eukprot:COSAG06_NODE_6952_length_2705_cov_1.929697_5_plen_67_part_00